MHRGERRGLLLLVAGCLVAAGWVTYEQWLRPSDPHELTILAAQARVCDLRLEVRPPMAPRFRRGDIDSNGSLELTDAVALLNYLFTGGAKPECLDALVTRE